MASLEHLLNPADSEASDRNWKVTVWEMIMRKACGLKSTMLKFAHLPAIGHTTLVEALEDLNWQLLLIYSLRLGSAYSV
jgi:hypothetical protein